MAALFNLEIHTPYRLFFSGQVEALVADIADGQIGVQAGRSPFIAPLRTGSIRILGKDQVWKEAAVSEGVLEVSPELVTVVSGAAEWPEEIDRTRAMEAKRRAQERLNEDMLAFEAARARASLARADNRLIVKDRTQG
jgi:F-type H+-transporting ATPase subunit epsilon